MSLPFLFSPATDKSNSDCSWVIGNDEDQASVSFTTFDLEPHSSCNYDHVEVLTSDSDEGPWSSKGKFCGTEKPADQTAPYIKVKFHTDGSVQHSGFKAEVSFKKAEDAEGITAKKGQEINSWLPFCSAVVEEAPVSAEDDKEAEKKADALMKKVSALFL